MQHHAATMRVIRGRNAGGMSDGSTYDGDTREGPGDAADVLALQPWAEECTGIHRRPKGLARARTTLEELLAWSGPASTAQLKHCALLKRMDTKFVVRLDTLLSLVAMLGGRYDVVLAGEKRIARYRTEYLDTPDHDFYRQHIQGRRPRYKARVRHYRDRHLAFVEVKEKRPSGQTYKSRRPLAYGARALDAETMAFVAETSHQVGSDFRSSLVVDFERVMWVHPTLQERITIDLGLHMRDGERSVGLGTFAVVEVKQDRFHARTPMMLALRDHGVRPASFSKYCAGLAALHPSRFSRYALDKRRILEHARRLP